MRPEVSWLAAIPNLVQTLHDARSNNNEGMLHCRRSCKAKQRAKGNVEYSLREKWDFGDILFSLRKSKFDKFGLILKQQCPGEAQSRILFSPIVVARLETCFSLTVPIQLDRAWEDKPYQVLQGYQCPAKFWVRKLFIGLFLFLSNEKLTSFMSLCFLVKIVNIHTVRTQLIL